MSIPLASVPSDELAADLEDWGPRVGADSGNPMMSGRIIHDADGFQVGIWECTPGGWAINDRPDSESVRLLAGRARLTNADGTTVELTRWRRPGPSQGLVGSVGHPGNRAKVLRRRQVTLGFLASTFR